MTDYKNFFLKSILTGIITSIVSVFIINNISGENIDFSNSLVMFLTFFVVSQGTFLVLHKFNKF